MKYNDRVKIAYQKVKNCAKKEYQVGNYDSALKDIVVCGWLMYLYAFKYCDSEIEGLLRKIAEQNIVVKKYKSESNKIIFYDALGWDYRDLGMEYIESLAKLGYKIIYVTLNKNKNEYKKISDCVKKTEGKVYVIRESQSLQGVIQLGEIINIEKPSKAFIQATPHDVVATSVFAAFEGRLERYMIDLTDHTFWLGTKCFDYCIEFRNIGYVKSYTDRRIDRKKLIILPYYPCDAPEKVFQGFSFDSEGKKVIYSGGNMYKIGGSDIYFKIAEHIINNYDDTIIYYTGNGTNKSKQNMYNWIKKNHYEERFIFEKERKDLDELMKHCYFYLNTYPVGGGLMTQYAVKNGKVPITLADNQEHMMQLLVDYKKEYEFIFKKYKSFIKRVDELLTDEEKIKKLESKVQKLIISPDEFEIELYNAINYKKTKYMENIDETDYFDYKAIASKRGNNDYKLVSKIVRTYNKKRVKEIPYIYLRGKVQEIIEKMKWRK